MHKLNQIVETTAQAICNNIEHKTCVFEFSEKYPNGFCTNCGRTTQLILCGSKQDNTNWVHRLEVIDYDRKIFGCRKCGYVSKIQKIFISSESKNIQIITLGESKILIDLNDIQEIKDAITYEVNRQIHKIDKKHIARFEISEIYERYGSAVRGLHVGFWTPSHRERYHKYFKRNSMVDNMKKALDTIITREKNVIEYNKSDKELRKEFADIVKTDFKNFKFKMPFGKDSNYAECVLKNKLEITIRRNFDKVELGYNPSNKINVLRILEALNNVKFEKEVEIDDEEDTDE